MPDICSKWSRETADGFASMRDTVLSSVLPLDVQHDYSYNLIRIHKAACSLVNHCAPLGDFCKRRILFNHRNIWIKLNINKLDPTSDSTHKSTISKMFNAKYSTKELNLKRPYLNKINSIIQSSCRI